jgi:hypothetical protein
MRNSFQIILGAKSFCQDAILPTQQNKNNDRKIANYGETSPLKVDAP